MTAQPQLLPDALLVERVAALGDKTALGELDRRHGMTLYAIAYTLLLDSETSDAVVAAALRALWRQAASFDPRMGTAAAWMAELTRRAARERLRERRPEQRPRAAQRIAPLRRLVRRGPRPRWRRVARLVRVAVARAARFAAALALPALLPR